MSFLSKVLKTKRMLRSWPDLPHPAALLESVRPIPTSTETTITRVDGTLTIKT